MLCRPASPGPLRSEVLVSHLDLFPTAMCALGLDPGPTHGASLLDGDPTEPRIAHSSLGAVGDPRRQESISDGRWRLLVSPGERPRLFDLSSDEGETTNVAGQHRQTLQRLNQAALDLARAAGPPIEGVERRMESDDVQAFDDMGYGGGDDGD